MTDIPLKLVRPLCFVDLETTGTDFGRDRVVEVAVVRLHPGGTEDTLHSRVNPCMPIPPASSAIHGIRDEDVQASPTFTDMAPALHAMLSGADVAGYNVRRFDVPMLETEFGRVSMATPFTDARIIDSYEIFQKLVSHSLVGALQFFCGRPHTSAHSAMGDVRATMDVLGAQLLRHGELPRDVEALARDTAPAGAAKYLEPTGKLVLNEAGAPCINFGKHRGRTLAELAKSDAGYLRWILEGTFHPTIKDHAKKALDGLSSVRVPLFAPPAERK